MGSLLDTPQPMAILTAHSQSSTSRRSRAGMFGLALAAPYPLAHAADAGHFGSAATLEELPDAPPRTEASPAPVENPPLASRHVESPPPGSPPFEPNPPNETNVEANPSASPGGESWYGHDRWPWLSAYYLGFAGGPLYAKSSAHAFGGGGYALAFTGGIAFLNEIPLNVSVGGVSLDDAATYTESVQDCYYVDGMYTNCGDPHDESSKISGGYFSFDSGYQRRFELSKVVYLVPGLLFGYQFSINRLRRGVDCAGCQELPVPNTNLNGAYVAPTVRVSFGRRGGFIALSIRSQWYVTGDLLGATLFGVEAISP